MMQIRTMNQREKLISQKKVRFFGLRKFFLCWIFLSGFLGLAYIFQVNKIAVIGYEIKEKEEEIKKLETENQQLKIDLASRQSIYLLEEKKMELGMISPEKVDFLELKENDKLVLAK